ncbi:hypothetical protein M1N64_01640, partial [Peptococcaceae bacterium]|nr:hypothetical protein [Peptococcaceae bacterium]
IMVDEQIMLLAVENPVWFVPVGYTVLWVTSATKAGIHVYAAIKYSEGRWKVIADTIESW